MGVAYPAAITAEMVVNDEIANRGVLSPATDIPCERFLERLSQKGITAQVKIESSL
jgi:saccharopine dehydrogenase-like NADP-dependent oxidoreductase